MFVALGFLGTCQVSIPSAAAGGADHMYMRGVGHANTSREDDDCPSRRKHEEVPRLGQEKVYRSATGWQTCSKDYILPV